MPIHPALRTGSPDRRYRDMKCTPGGVMLLVRLHADLSAQPEDLLVRMGTLDLAADPASELPAGSRLAATFAHLAARFGPGNAVRAAVETAREVLKDRASAASRSPTP